MKYRTADWSLETECFMNNSSERNWLKTELSRALKQIEFRFCFGNLLQIIFVSSCQRLPKQAFWVPFLLFICLRYCTLWTCRGFTFRYRSPWHQLTELFISLLGDPDFCIDNRFIMSISVNKCCAVALLQLRLRECLAWTFLWSW